MLSEQLEAKTFRGVLRIASACVGWWLAEHEHYLDDARTADEYREIERAGEVLRELVELSDTHGLDLLDAAIEYISEWLAHNHWYDGCGYRKYEEVYENSEGTLKRLVELRNRIAKNQP